MLRFHNFTRFVIYTTMTISLSFTVSPHGPLAIDTARRQRSLLVTTFFPVNGIGMDISTRAPPSFRCASIRIYLRASAKTIHDFALKRDSTGSRVYSHLPTFFSPDFRHFCLICSMISRLRSNSFGQALTSRYDFHAYFSLRAYGICSYSMHAAMLDELLLDAFRLHSRADTSRWFHHRIISSLRFRIIASLITH